MAARAMEIARPLGRAEGLDVLDVTFRREGGHHVLRLTIEREDGPTSVADCVNLSRLVGPALEELVPSSFNLEVTSAGATRPLHSLDDFRRSIGRSVVVNLRSGRPGQLTGFLREAGENGITVELPDGTRKLVGLDAISSARRELDVSPPRPGGGGA